MDSTEMIRAMDALLDRVQTLERSIGRTPLRVPPGRENAGARAVKVAANYSALAALTGLVEGDLGYTQDSEYWWGWRNLGTPEWRILHPFYGGTAPSGIGEKEGDFWCDTTNHILYWRNNSAWKKLSHFTV